MSKRIAVELNIPRLVAKNGRLQGTIPFSQFKRLGDYILEPVRGDLDVELVFGGADQHANGTVRGWIHGEVALECHRCSREMVHRFDDRFKLAFVYSDAEADELDEHFDPVLLDESGHIHSVDLLEDELILQLPISPRHDDSEDCVDDSLFANEQESTDLHDAQQRENPFAALKKLKLN